LHFTQQYFSPQPFVVLCTLPDDTLQIQVPQKTPKVLFFQRLIGSGKGGIGEVRASRTGGAIAGG
jgi:hypothetical protein